MPAVPVLIHGKTYSINCADGEQERIKKLSDFVNEKIASILPSCRSANEATILSFSLLAIADEMFQIRHYVQQMEQKWQNMPAAVENTKMVMPEPIVQQQYIRTFHLDTETQSKILELMEGIKTLRQDMEQVVSS